ncbi:MAG TPA: hypothetical protein VGR47_14535 [Terracidiphilus sp.]|nr:hypothetical protein [Terracidiphilus sp.]
MATLLEKIVDERVGQTLVGSVSVAVDRIAEDIAREALRDETFRQALHELVRVRSQKLLDQLLENGSSNRHVSKRQPKRRKSGLWLQNRSFRIEPVSIFVS